MVRTRRQKNIMGKPYTKEYIPKEGESTGIIILCKEGYEAVRLVDREELTQQQAAALMQTSQASISRLLAQTRKKLVDAIAEGKTILFE